MLLARTGSALGGAVMAAAVLLGMACVWLVLADPRAVADAVNERGAQALVEEAAGLLAHALVQVARWL